MLNDLMNRAFQAELTEGHHTCTLKSWSYYADQHSKPENDYIALTFQHEKGESRNNMFEKDMSIFLSHVRRQLGKADETIDPKAFLKDLIDNNTPFDVWVKYNVVTTRSGLRRVRNLYFIEPLATASTASTAESADDTELPPGV